MVNGKRLAGEGLDNRTCLNLRILGWSNCCITSASWRSILTAFSSTDFSTIWSIIEQEAYLDRTVFACREVDSLHHVAEAATTERLDIIIEVAKAVHVPHAVLELNVGDGLRFKVALHEFAQADLLRGAPDRRLCAT